RLHGRDRARIASGGHNDVHTEPDQLRRKPGQPSQIAVCEAILDDNILADVVAEAPQASLEHFSKADRSLAERDHEVSHPVDPPCRLLRAPGKWPRCCRAAEERGELAPSHVFPLRENLFDGLEPNTLRRRKGSQSILDAATQCPFRSGATWRRGQ